MTQQTNQKDIRYRIRLKAVGKGTGYEVGEEITLYNDIFNKQNGIAFYPLNKDWEVISADQFTGLQGKDGNDVYKGDTVRYRKPYRTTQTHEGDNIPNGSYTEPMEPGIKEIEGEVKFKDGMFFIDEDSDYGDLMTPLQWHIRHWDLESIKESISWTRQTPNWFDDPEEGDLEYLIKECAGLETAEQLIEYLSGIEIIGNIHENHELLNQ